TPPPRPPDPRSLAQFRGASALYPAAWTTVKDNAGRGDQRFVTRRAGWRLRRVASVDRAARNLVLVRSAVRRNRKRVASATPHIDPTHPATGGDDLHGNRLHGNRLAPHLATTQPPRRRGSPQPSAANAPLPRSSRTR